MAVKRLGRKLLTNYLKLQNVTDSHLRKLLRETMDEADRIIRSLEGETSISAKVRLAQTKLARIQIVMWSGIEDAIKSGMIDSAIAAAEMMSNFDAGYLESLGLSMDAWERSQIATARRTVRTLISRDANNISLSEKVYRNRQRGVVKVSEIINRDILLGRNAREIARSVRGLVNPSTPGGISYAAFRLGRTELNNAFHRTSQDLYDETPWVETVKWNLSGSHPKPDICDDYAKKSHFKNGGPGQFKTGKAPNKPHPQCLCYIEPETIDEDEFVRNFARGNYDDYLDGKIKDSSNKAHRTLAT